MRYDDGVLTLHQSDISHYLICPEQFRVVNGISPGEMPGPDSSPLRVETDAASIGTTLHAVIEHELRGDVFKTKWEVRDFARRYLGGLIKGYVENEVEYRCETYGDDPTKALRALDRLVGDWYDSNERQYWLQRDPKSYLIEHSFDVPFIERPGDRYIRQIRLGGTADIIDMAENRVVDWKSGSRKYQRWEKQRWAVQPTVYTYAAHHEGLIEPSADGLTVFEFRIFLRDGKGGAEIPQSVLVTRGQGQWAWLTQLVNNIADMCESDAAMWPLSDDHALCGPKWCPVWHQCKGQFVDDNWN